MMNASPGRIHVVNPNSNEAVTRGLDAALDPLRFTNGPEIVCSTLAEGPFGIETQADVESVVMPLRRMVEADNSSDAFVIACYSDPGLHVCRECTTRPVFGIAECGVLTALAHAGRFGVIAISQRSIARHRRYLPQMGLTDRLAGERPLEMSVAETARGEKTLERIIDIGRQLKEEDGAEALVMGCAGMARHRSPLEKALGIPVIDPTQAAVTMALGYSSAALDSARREPLGISLPHQREGLAERGIEISEQARHRPVDIQVHVHACRIDNAGPRVQVNDLAHA
jgi:allantoin racemase